jgi:hypothetical protein
MTARVTDIPTSSHSGDPHVITDPAREDTVLLDDRKERQIWRWSLPALFLAALALRVQNLDSQPWGDEAYYYFITHNLAAFWNAGLYPLSGSTLPVFPLVYHLFAGNFESLRVANAVVGASAVPLGMVIMREVGVGRIATLCGGAFLAVNTVLVMFSGMAFLDMLGAVIALGALLAYVRGHYGVAAALVALATLEKGYYAVFGLALAVDQVTARRRIPVELIVAAIPVGTWLLLRYAVQGASLHYMMSAHSHDALNVGAVDKAVGSLALLPLLAVSVRLSARLRGAALFLGMFLLILLIWGNAQDWYWCLSAILATVLATHGMTLLLARSRQQPVVIGTVTMLLLVAFAPQAVRTYQYITTWHGRGVYRVAAYLDRQPAQRVDTVGCGLLTYYPLEAPSRPTRMFDGWDGVSERIVVVCPKAPPAPDGWNLLYRTGEYAVLGHRPQSGYGQPGRVRSRGQPVPMDPRKIGGRPPGS